ncbi:homoserine kinase [Flocculibacter collagenilyticus]|uniref:homoserine kinase n=1 Tax=Flocculibacter collagenilyticus TaxID=2744479 RepID=UPI0018F489A6|nr:homoserine kinase [Flocculibacter collagenilyticus]
MMVSVFAPASIGNVSVGFDLLGAAIKPIDGEPLGDVVTASLIDSGITVTTTGRFAHKLPDDAQQNIVYQCAAYFLVQLDDDGINHKRANTSSSENSHDNPYENKRGVHLTLEKRLPIGSGLGSSASSIVACLSALNQLFGHAFSDDQLLLMMGEFEGKISGSIHYDNVAPSYLGGMQLMVEQPNKLTSTLPIIDNWYWVVAYSGASVSTAAAREVLPKTVELSTAITFAKNLAVFVDAVHNKDSHLAEAMLNDVIAEPHRQHLLPNFEQAKAQLSYLGVKTVGISGSGPTIFAVAHSLAQATAAKQCLEEHYIQHDTGFAHICQIDDIGAREITI